MAATPIQLQQALRRLAGWPATDLPVISAYLDLRPQATGGDPQVRSGLIVLRDRLREIEREIEPRSAAHQSLISDVERIDEYISDTALPGVQCLCLFACHGADEAFEALDSARAVEDEVSTGGRPRLLPLARLADEEAAVVAVADTNTLRLFGLRSGALEEIGVVDDENDDYRRASGGGWSQSRFQRHVDDHREAFAQLAAQAIDEVVGREDAQLVVLGGDEVALPLLTDALPRPLAERAHTGLRIDMRATLEEVAGEALAFIEALRSEQAQRLADELVGAARAGGLAVSGARATHAALERGQVEQVMLDAAAEFEAELAEDIVRLAATTGARIRFVADHGGLRKAGGVGGVLRFGLDADVSEAQSGERREGATVTG